MDTVTKDERPAGLHKTIRKVNGQFVLICERIDHNGNIQTACTGLHTDCSECAAKKADEHKHLFCFGL